MDANFGHTGPHLALYEPDMAPNVGTLMRLVACLGVPIHVIEPCGFPFSKRSLKRSLMDYEPHVMLYHHADWDAFHDWYQTLNMRLILMTTKAAKPYFNVTFTNRDIMMVGSEGRGVGDHVHQAATERLLIPMRPGLRSVNVATAASMVLGEALRQTGHFDHIVSKSS